MHVLTLYVGVASCFGLGVSLHRTFNDNAALSRSKMGFEEARLVPDVLPAFNPQGTLAIHLADGKVLRRPGVATLSQELQACPEVQLYPGKTGQLSPIDTFTLIFLDPDSPTHANPSGAKLHLLATGMALDRYHDPVETYKLVNTTPFLVDWLSPTPEVRTGVHRYTLLLYKGVASHASVPPFQDAALNRSGFNLTQFTQAAGLADPYAGAVMNLDSALPEDVTQLNAPANSSSRRLIDAYTLNITIVLSFLGAIFLA